MTRKTVEIDGIEYYTLLESPSTARKDEPPILLCHDLMSNHHMWDSTVTALNAAGYSTLRFDHLGHNKTPPPTNSNAAYHMDDITRHMHTLVTGQQKAKSVIGCSIGGVLALGYAMLYPEDISSVMSIAAPGISSPPAAHDLWTQRIQLLEEDVRTGKEELCLKTVERWCRGNEEGDVDVRARALPLVRTCSLEGYIKLADMIRGYDYADEVGSLRARTMVVAGSEYGAARPEDLEGVARSTCKLSSS